MNQNEFHIQTALVIWLKVNHPKILFTASAGGMRSSAKQGAKMNKMGYRAGCPDLMFFEARGGYHGLLIEMKDKAGKPSRAQLDFLKQADKNGYLSYVAYGYDDAVRIITDYLTNNRKG